MKKVLSLPFIAICIITLSFRCNQPSENCENVVCTADFRMIAATLVDNQGNSFAPDKVETILNGSIINTSTQPNIPGSNDYTIVDDSNMQNIGFNNQQSVLFLIYKNGQVIKTVSYVIKADCCHIDKVSGDGVVVVN